jgi:hypothetical protein
LTRNKLNEITTAAKELHHLVFLSKKRAFSILLIVSIINFSYILSGECEGVKLYQDYPGHATDVNSPLSIKLNLSQIPLLDQPTNVSCEVNSAFDSPNTTAILNLPDGSILLTGNLNDRWDLKANVPAYLNATIKFTKSGEFQIEAIARRMIDTENSWADIDVRYVTIGLEKSYFTPAPNYARLGGHAPSAEDGQMIIDKIESLPLKTSLSPLEDLHPKEFLIKSSNDNEEILMNVDQNSTEIKSPSLGTLTVTGKWSYYTSLGDYRAPPYTKVPAKYFYVMIVDGNGNYLGGGYTDESGDFSIAVANPGNVGIRARLYRYSAWSFSGGPTRELRVVYQGDSLDGDGLTDIWHTYSNVYVFSDGIHSIGEWWVIEGDTQQDSCWLLDDLIRTFRFAPNDPGACTVRWYPGNPDATEYLWGGQVHINGADSRSSDVSIHEYSHNIMYTKYGNWMPPNPNCHPHYMGLISSEGCAWTEGFAEFNPFAVNNNPLWHWPAGGTLNFETPSWGVPADWNNGDQVEGRVAGALWDIYDTSNDGSDIYSYPFYSIWNVIFSQRLNTFSEFWNSWLSNGYSTNARYCIYQNTIDYPALGWNSLGGYVTSSPSVIVDNQGKTEVWVKGGDNSLWVNIDESWSGKGGVLTSDPFAIKDYNGKIHVLVRGSDYAVWDFIYDPAASNGHWKCFGGYITAGPTGAMEPTYHNFLRVAVRGGDNALWQCDLNINTEAYNWYTNGGILTSAPYVIFDPASRQHTLLRGNDNSLWDCEGLLGPDGYYHWTWSSLGGSLLSGPTACIEPTFANYVAVFVKGDDNALWMNSVYSATQPETGTWYRLGGIISSDPFAVADASANKIHVFARGGDSALWENIFSTSPWDPNAGQWKGIGGLLLTHKPGANIGSDTQAFVIGTDHAVWKNTHTTFSATSSEANSSQKQEETNQLVFPVGDQNSGGGES